MTSANVDDKAQVFATDDLAGVLEQGGQELILYRLRCAKTANGLSHYYMHGDVSAEETVL